MPVPVIMPKLSMTMEQGEIASWLKAEGEAVEKGEALLEINTDKVSFEVESPATGVLQRILAGSGERVPVTQTIAYILLEGERPVEQPGDAAGDAPRVATTRVRATPAARRAAREGGIDLASVTGSGVGGAVTSGDVSAAIGAASIEGRTAIPSTPFTGEASTGRVAAEEGQAEPLERIVPLSDMRATIAARMTQSATTAPHVPVTALVDFEEVERLRANLARIPTLPGGDVSHTAGHTITYTDILVKVAASALRRHPGVNSSFRDDGVHIMNDVNIGIAVAVPGGLVVPVIRNADEKGLRSIARERAALIEKARNRELQPGDTGGGTFTLSNLGVKDVEWFCPIINPPEAAILGIGRISPRAVVREGEVVARLTAYFTLVFDHRALDGVAAAAFLETLKTLIENPVMLLE